MPGSGKWRRLGNDDPLLTIYWQYCNKNSELMAKKIKIIESSGNKQVDPVREGLM